MNSFLREFFASWFGSKKELMKSKKTPDTTVRADKDFNIFFKKPKRKINRVFIHCSASDKPDHDDIHIIRRWHTNPPPGGNGWTDVGYHFFITKQGDIQEGRPIERTPAAQYRYNTGTIAICVSGFRDFKSVQFDTLRKLCDAILAELPGVTFHGHCEVSAKECPVFDYKGVLGLNSRGQIVKP